MSKIFDRKLLLCLLLLFLSPLLTSCYSLRSNSNIDKIIEENNRFYELCNEAEINVGDYVLYEEVFTKDNYYYLIFTEYNTAILEDEDVLQGIMLQIEADITTEYTQDIEFKFEDPYYVLPSLWIAGGGTAYTTTVAFLKRAELRRFILEAYTNIIEQEITIKIEDSYCLGKIEF